MENSIDYLRVGVITNSHGIKGEVKVFPTTDDINRYDLLKEVYIDKKNKFTKFEIESVKYFKQMVILKFKDINNINDVLIYKGMDLYIDRKDAIPLEPGEYFIADILGCKVITDDNNELGFVKEVLTSSANDVYVVETTDNKEILIPVIDECILDVDIDKKEIKVHLLKGLI